MKKNLFLTLMVTMFVVKCFSQSAANEGIFGNTTLVTVPVNISQLEVKGRLFT